MWKQENTLHDGWNNQEQIHTAHVVGTERVDGLQKWCLIILKLDLTKKLQIPHLVVCNHLAVLLQTNSNISAHIFLSDQFKLTSFNRIHAVILEYLLQV